ncbi:MAG: hypothetical protein D6776_04545 [Planctomycetota bacterium]|nr:MAG: hypothetical protein D6776_04545 [Planctomycetota bacterium]
MNAARRGSHFRCLISLAMLLAIAAGRARATELFFDDFSGSGLDPAVWSANANGYPNGIAVNASWLELGVPGTSTLDFPYVTPVGSLFPAAGDFAFEVRFRYTSVAGKGVGLVVLDGSNNDLGGFWQDVTAGLTYTGYAGTGGSVDTSAHLVRWELVGNELRTRVDGSLIGSQTIASRPASFWVGHPTIGQTLEVGGPVVDANGTVVDRWWGTGVWTTLALDSVRVESLGVPEPAGVGTVVLALAAAGAAGFGRRRRG